MDGRAVDLILCNCIRSVQSHAVCGRDMVYRRLRFTSQIWPVGTGNCHTTSLLPIQCINEVLDNCLPLVCDDALGMELHPLRMSISDVKSLADTWHEHITGLMHLRLF